MVFDYDNVDVFLNERPSGDYQRMLGLGFSFDEEDPREPEALEEPEALKEPLKEPPTKKRDFEKRRDFEKNRIRIRKRQRSLRTFGGARWENRLETPAVELDRVPTPYTPEDLIDRPGSVDEHMCNIIFSAAHIARVPGDDGYELLMRMIGHDEDDEDDEDTAAHFEDTVRDMVLQRHIVVGTHDRDHGIVTIDREAIANILSTTTMGSPNGNSLPARVNGGKKPTGDAASTSTLCCRLEKEYETHHSRCKPVGKPVGNDTHLERIHCGSAGFSVLFKK
jgi:hypothetical protein